MPGKGRIDTLQRPRLFPERRADIGTGRRCELECTFGQGDVRRIRIRRDDVVAVWLNHFCSLGEKILVQMQLELLKDAFHGRIPRCEFEFVVRSDFLAGDVYIICHLMQIEGGCVGGNGGFYR
jgi:hypothetical protein